MLKVNANRRGEIWFEDQDGNVLPEHNFAKSKKRPTCFRGGSRTQQKRRKSLQRYQRGLLQAAA